MQSLAPSVFSTLPLRRVSRRSSASARPALRRGSVAVRAASEQPSEEPKSLSFAPSDRAMKGYTAGDSAGQSNIFAIEPKTYVAGSEADKTDTSMSNKYVGTGAAMALALGILVARFGSGPDYSYEGQQTLSYFVNLFSAAQ